MARQQYRCVAAGVDGFIQQLAVSYLRHGYWFYVTGVVPEGKDPATVDAKLIAKYSIGVSKWARAWRKSQGQASMQYLRHDRFFVLLATHGEHPFFEQESGQVRDARRHPIRYAGYAVSYRGGHPHVRIERCRFNEFKAFFADVATKWSESQLSTALGGLGFAPYAPVRSQLFILLRAVNRKRTEAGLPLVPNACLPLRRRIVAPFGVARSMLTADASKE